MISIETILAASFSTLLGYVAYLERRLYGMNDAIAKRTTEDDVEHLIDVHDWVTKVEIKGLKEDIKELKEENKARMEDIKELLEKIHEKL